MSDFVPILSRDRRLEIIARVSAKMEAERRARGHHAAADRIVEFFGRIAGIVRGDSQPSGATAWVAAGLDARPTAPEPQRPALRDHHEPRGGELWD